VALLAFAAIAAVLMIPLAFDALSLDGLMRATSAAFVAVYVTATAAGAKLLDGSARVCAGIAFAAVVVILGFSGPYVLVPAVLAVAGIFFAPLSIPSRAVRL